MYISPVSYRLNFETRNTNFQKTNIKDVKNTNNAAQVQFRGSVSENTAATRTTEPNLRTYMALMNVKMGNDENIKFFTNGLYSIDTDTKRNHGALQIADIGCCNGALCRKLSPYLPSNTHYFGLDLSENMIQKAIIEDKKQGRENTHYVVGNAFNMPYEENSKDAIILSSIMHELYSYNSEEYNEDAYSKDSVLHFMQSAYKCLKPGGVLIIKDPATASTDVNEPVKIANANKNDGELPVIEDIEDLKKADITKLSTYDKLRRFAEDFYPAKGQIEWDENGDCIMPRWLVTEWVRHRKWLKTPENWAYEIKERYGTLRPDEVFDFAKKTGFDTVKIQNIAIPNETNIYKIREGEFEIKDMNNNTLNLEDFPMFLEVVLRKPRDV